MKKTSPWSKQMQSSGFDRKGSSKQESVLPLEVQSHMICDLAFFQNRSHKCNTPTLKHKANINIKWVRKSLARPQENSIWISEKRVKTFERDFDWFPKIKQALLKGDGARDWETVWLSCNFKIQTLHHGHTQQEYFGKLNPSSSTCKHGDWTTVPLCRCVQLRILVTDRSCRFEGNEQIFKQLLNFQLTTMCYVTCYQMPFWWKSRFRQLTVLQLSNQTTPLQTPKGFSKS